MKAGLVKAVGQACLLLLLTGVLSCTPARSRFTDPLDKPLPPAEPISAAEEEAATGASAPRSYVILLPDEEGGSSGELLVTSGEEVVTLNEPNQGTSLEHPARSFTAEPNHLKRFDPALAAEPPATLRFEILFDSDAAQPTAEAIAAAQFAIDRIKSWPAPEISIAGHADRQGGTEHNQDLSRRRAEAARILLERLGIEGVTWEIQAFGESAPIVATADGVAEAGNRRVELVIR